MRYSLVGDDLPTMLVALNRERVLRVGLDERGLIGRLALLLAGARVGEVDTRRKILSGYRFNK